MIISYEQPCLIRLPRLRETIACPFSSSISKHVESLACGLSYLEVRRHSAQLSEQASHQSKVNQVIGEVLFIAVVIPRPASIVSFFGPLFGAHCTHSWPRL